MIVMKYFCHYCSVRLGTLITASFTILQLITSILLSHVFMMDDMDKEKHERDLTNILDIHTTFEDVVNKFLENNHSAILLTFDLYYSACIVSCVLATYGAIKVG